MEYLIIYLIFCLTTALTAYYTIYRPIINQLKIATPLNPVAQYPLIGALTFTALGVLAAPALILILLSPDAQLQFSDALTTSLKD